MAKHEIVLQDTVTSASITLPHCVLVHPIPLDGVAHRTAGRAKLVASDLLGFEDCPFSALALTIRRTLATPDQLSFLEAMRCQRHRFQLVIQDTDLDLRQPWPTPRNFQGLITTYSEGLTVNRTAEGIDRYQLTLPVDEAFDVALGDLRYPNILQVYLDATNSYAFSGGTFAEVPADTLVEFTPFWRQFADTDYAWTFPAGFSSTSVITQLAEVTTPATPGTYACEVTFTNANGDRNTFAFDVEVV